MLATRHGMLEVSRLNISVKMPFKVSKNTHAFGYGASYLKV